MSEHQQERKVLIGYDGTRDSEDAIVLGRVFAEVLAARPLVVTVVLYPDHLVQGKEQEVIAARRAAPVQDVALDRLQGHDPQAIAVAADSPAHALHELAEREGPLLIVLGSTHRSPVGRVLLGSVGESLLSGAPCAIAVAPRDYARRQEHRLARIGVAVNGSSESWSAFASAVSMAAHLHAALIAISVAEPPRYGTSLAILAAAEYESAEHKHATEVLAETEGNIPAGTSFTPLLRSGLPEKELAKAAEELDLLILGSRGYGPVRRTLLGGVSAKLMRLSPCPVLILPRRAGDDPLRLQDMDRE